jgi:hypothetical protein
MNPYLTYIGYIVVVLSIIWGPILTYYLYLIYFNSSIQKEVKAKKMKSKNNQKGFLTVLGTVALVVVIVGSVASVSTAVNNNNAESVETPSLTVEQSK